TQRPNPSRIDCSMASPKREKRGQSPFMPRGGPRNGPRGHTRALTPSSVSPPRAGGAARPLRDPGKTKDRLVPGLGRKEICPSSKLAEWTGLEPATPGVTGRYSNQLNYHSIFYLWWVLRGSNPRPSPCKGDALPAELSTLGQSRSVYGIPQRLASLEPRNVAGRDLDRVARLRVAPLTCRPVLHAERAEPDDRDLLPLLQRIGDGVDHRVDGAAGLGLGKVGRASDGIDQFRFVHSCPLRKDC